MNDEYDPTRPFQSGDDPDLDWEDEEGSPKLLWGRVLALAGILLLAFLLGRATSPDDSAAEVEELRDQLARAQDTIDELQTTIPTEQPTDIAPTVTISPTDEPTDDPTDGETEDGDGGDGRTKTYTVQPGDTFVSIAEDEFGEANPDVVSCLVDANGGDDVISPGDEVEIPQECGE